MYGHLWGTPAVRAVFEERGRLQGWLVVLAALARAQAAEGVVPSEAAEAITAHATVELLDLSVVAAQTRASGHGTLGLIRALEEAKSTLIHDHIEHCLEDAIGPASREQRVTIEGFKKISRYL